jgi:hypothetical protein
LGNEKNEYPVPDPDRTMVNITNELSDTHKNFLRKEIMEEFIEIPMEKLQDTVN